MLRRVEGARLAYYFQAADAGYWEAHWREVVSAEFYASAARGELGPFESIFPRYLPGGGRVLEAGCGLGQYVLALRERGYDAEGIDWAADTVSEARRRFRDLPVRQGDATAIDVSDGFYSGYISLGVVEHRREGPQPFLDEAARVLRPGGMALIAVPQFHLLRRAKAALGAYRDEVAQASFYQYAFRAQELAELCRTAGFEVIARQGYDAYKGLKDEWRLFARVFARRFAGRDLGYLTQRVLQRVRPLESALGHMVMLVCRKPE
jgi:SAM-dependent methyltransferase